MQTDRQARVRDRRLDRAQPVRVLATATAAGAPVRHRAPHIADLAPAVPVSSENLMQPGGDPSEIPSFYHIVALKENILAGECLSVAGPSGG